MDTAIEIRDPSRELLWYLSLSSAEQLSQKQFFEFFGASAYLIPNCRGARDDCYHSVWEKPEHSVLAAQETPLPYGASTAVTTPNGQFEMIWATTVLISVAPKDCGLDGRPPISNEAFEARRVAK